MTESGALWPTFRSHLSPHGLLRRVEDSTGPGFPDVFYAIRGATGVVELKHDPSWPARASTLYRPRCRREQMDFLETVDRNGGRAWMMVQVERDYFLLSARAAVRLWRDDGWCRTDLAARADVAARHRFPTHEVLRCLTM